MADATTSTKPQHPADHMRALTRRLRAIPHLAGNPRVPPDSQRRLTRERAALQWALEQLSGRTTRETVQ